MESITSANKALILGGQKQLVNIVCLLANNTSFTLTEANIMENSLVIDRATSYGDTYFLGSAACSQLDFTIADYNGTYSAYDFHNARLDLNLCLNIGGTRTAVCALGRYYVLTAKRDIKQIKITALDILSIPKRGSYAAMDDISDRAGDSGWNVALGTILGNISNKVFGNTTSIDYSAVNSLCTSPLMSKFQYPSGADVTYHNLLAWCAALTGTIARAHGNANEIQLARNGASGENITKAQRYKGRCEEQDVALTGIKAVDASGNEYSAGTAGYELNITSNGIFEQAYNQDDGTDYRQTLINNLWTNMGALTVRPFSATTLPYPWLECGDAITYTDDGGTAHSSIITHIRFVLNGKMIMECRVPSNEEQAIDVLTPPSIKRSTITTEMLRINAIKSINYVDQAGDYSAAGTWFDLARGLIKSKNFAIDEDGNAFFKGYLVAEGGQIGLLTITSQGISLTAGSGINREEVTLLPNRFTFQYGLSYFELTRTASGIALDSYVTDSGGSLLARLQMDGTDGGKLSGTWDLGIPNGNGNNF